MDTVKDFRDRFADLQKAKAQGDTLFNDLVMKYEEVCKDKLQIERELKKSKDTEQKWYDDAEDLRAKNDELNLQDNKLSFTLVLIDGDGYIFKEEFLKKGAEGGRQAAKMLVEKVQQETGPDGMVVVHVFVNMEGFRKTLLLNRLVDSEYTLTEFVDGFEHAKKNVDLIDAGSRKGAADRKILEYYHLHKYQRQCKTIVIGGCHDRDYYNELDEDRDDSFVWTRLRLLAATPPERDFKKLNLPIFYIDSLFRSEKLTPHQNGVGSSNAQAQSGLNPTVAMPASSTKPATTEPYANVVRAATLDTPVNTTITMQSAAKPDSSASPRRGQGKLHLNSLDQRVDDPIPPHDPAPFYTRRERGEKFCSNYHLGAGCSGPCDYSHDPLDRHELLALKKAARLNPCAYGNDCTNPSCYFGHQCFYGAKCNKGDGCKFARLHDKSTRIARTETF